MNIEHELGPRLSPRLTLTKRFRSGQKGSGQNVVVEVVNHAWTIELARSPPGLLNWYIISLSCACVPDSGSTRTICPQSPPPPTTRESLPWITWFFFRAFLLFFFFLNMDQWLGDLGGCGFRCSHLSRMLVFFVFFFGDIGLVQFGPPSMGKWIVGFVNHTSKSKGKKGQRSP